MPACRVRIYGSDRRGHEGPLTFLPLSNLPFLEDLASCRAVISTAGNQLIGEAMFLGKPVCVMPEACAEQRLNAAAVERMGIGMQVSTSRFSDQCMRTFLDRHDHYASNLSRHVCDGLEQSLEAIERFLTELAPGASRAEAAVAVD